MQIRSGNVFVRVSPDPGTPVRVETGCGTGSGTGMGFTIDGPLILGPWDLPARFSSGCDGGPGIIGPRPNSLQRAVELSVPGGGSARPGFTSRTVTVEGKEFEVSCSRCDEPVETAAPRLALPSAGVRYLLLGDVIDPSKAETFDFDAWFSGIEHFRVYPAGFRKLLRTIHFMEPDAEGRFIRNLISREPALYGMVTEVLMTTHLLPLLKGVEVFDFLSRLDDSVISGFMTASGSGPLTDAVSRGLSRGRMKRITTDSGRWNPVEKAAEFGREFKRYLDRRFARILHGSSDAEPGGSDGGFIGGIDMNALEGSLVFPETITVIEPPDGREWLRILGTGAGHLWVQMAREAREAAAAVHSQLREEGPSTVRFTGISRGDILALRCPPGSGVSMCRVVDPGSRLKEIFIKPVWADSLEM